MTEKPESGLKSEGFSSESFLQLAGLLQALEDASRKFEESKQGLKEAIKQLEDVMGGLPVGLSAGLRKAILGALRQALEGLGPLAANVPRPPPEPPKAPPEPPKAPPETAKAQPEATKAPPETAKAPPVSFPSGSPQPVLRRVPAPAPKPAKAPPPPPPESQQPAAAGPEWMDVTAYAASRGIKGQMIGAARRFDRLPADAFSGDKVNATVLDAYAVRDPAGKIKTFADKPQRPLPPTPVLQKRTAPSAARPWPTEMRGEADYAPRTRGMSVEHAVTVLRKLGHRVEAPQGPSSPYHVDDKRLGPDAVIALAACLGEGKTADR